MPVFGITCMRSVGMLVIVGSTEQLEIVGIRYISTAVHRGMLSSCTTLIVTV
jgi:hypothetical protein